MEELNLCSEGRSCVDNAKNMYSKRNNKTRRFIIHTHTLFSVIMRKYLIKSLEQNFLFSRKGKVYVF
jgi:hypothetical protein